ncbi:formamidopyrimidine-DNA glycosylase, partial [Patescibacteria group bacterium]|nr:formamidopyrimidine-DNA glycosylase [Patescibacteria group bacterium]
MPELPEVETISRQLNRKLRGKKIVDVKISLPKIVMVTAQKLRQAVVGQKIVRVYRRAKLVVVELENGCSMIVHLKMTGQLLLAKKRSEASNHVHVVFDFVDGSHLFFREVRQFGYIDLLSAAELAELFEKFGPEPLNKNFSPQIFKKRLQQRKRSKIKPLLLDPKFLAGIGNIY